jgi:hypothetical protein
LRIMRAARKFAAMCRTFDHTCIVHSIWAVVWQMGCGMYVVRVPSKENLADDPSRERYGLLAGMKVPSSEATVLHVHARGVRLVSMAGDKGAPSARPPLPRRSGMGVACGDGTPRSRAFDCH